MENKKTSTTILKISILLFVFGCVFVKEASALTLSPARIEISGEKGEVIKKDITLYNDSKFEETYYASYSNFESQGETGSPKFVEPKEGLGTWLNVGREVTLKAGESKTLPLEINIPNDAYSGGHFAVVFFGNSPDSKDGGQVSIGAKTGILILLSVKGDVLEKGGIIDFNTYNINKEGELIKGKFFNSLPVAFQYRFKNDGNDRIKPSGEIKIKNIFYLTTEKINANEVSGNILPHSTRLFRTDWKTKDKEIKTHDSFFGKALYQWRNFALGPYWASLDLTFGAKATNEKEYTFFFVFPWQLIICLIVIILIILYFGKKIITRYNRYIIKKARAG